MTVGVPLRRRGLRAVSITVGGVLVLVLTGVAVLMLAVSPTTPDFAPQAWTPGPGAALLSVVATAVPASSTALEGPEDIAVGSDGSVYTGDRTGRIWRRHPDGRLTVHAEVGGRPLGLVHDGATLLVANHGVGLQSVGPDGVIWFTDSSTRHNTTVLGPDSPSYLLPDLIEGRPTGRLLAHDPRTGRTRQVLDGLYFPNGVAIAAAGTEVWIAESTRYRLLRHRLTDGVTETLHDDLPGVPDGLTATADGEVLVALTDRAAALDRFVLPTALGREILARLPVTWFVRPDAPPPGSVLVLAPDGTPRLHVTGLDPAPTTAVADGDRWWIGALLSHPLRTLTPPDPP